MNTIKETSLLFKKMRAFKQYKGKIEKVEDFHLFRGEDRTLYFIFDSQQEAEAYIRRFPEYRQKTVADLIEKIDIFYILAIEGDGWILEDILPTKDYFLSIDRNESNILLHIPHQEIRIPEWSMPDYVIDNVLDESIIMSDRIVGELVFERFTIDNILKFNYSRIFLDVERFDDARESMAEQGFGRIYKTTSKGELLRNISKENEKLIIDIYDNYHKVLKTKAETLVNIHGERAVIVDLHSFPGERRFYEPEGQRPDICIGFNEALEEAGEIKTIFEDFGFGVLFNEPFAGSMQPEGTDIKSLMIEINRDLYLDKKYNYVSNEKLREALKRVFSYLN